MISFTALQHALIEADRQKEVARLADEARPLLDHEHYYSHAYLVASWRYDEVYRQWRTVYEEVCFPLTAIGVLYDPTIDLFMDKDTIKLPIVEFPTDKMAAISKERAA